jgi:hypothetical protein
VSYVSLAEAAQAIERRTGVDASVEQLLRAGIAGRLPIVALFSGEMRNLTTHADEDYLGLLVIPPRHLIEISTDGRAVIKGAFSLDGATAYSPQQVRELQQMMTLNSNLEDFIRAIEISSSADVSFQRSPTTSSTKPVQRSAAQERAILNAIREAGFEPLGLPKMSPGKAGAKAKVRAILANRTDIFPVGSKVFDKAWERLTNASEIAYAV